MESVLEAKLWRVFFFASEQFQAAQSFVALQL